MELQDWCVSDSSGRWQPCSRARLKRRWRTEGMQLTATMGTGPGVLQSDMSVFFWSETFLNFPFTAYSVLSFNFKWKQISICHTSCFFTSTIQKSVGVLFFSSFPRQGVKASSLKACYFLAKTSSFKDTKDNYSLEVKGLMIRNCNGILTNWQNILTSWQKLANCL